jgi:hypothetical protein
MKIVSKQIELGIERMNHGHWLKVSIPYSTTLAMTATLQNNNGELLRSVNLMTGHNLIDIQAINNQSVHIKIETPFEVISKELYLE